MKKGDKIKVTEDISHNKSHKTRIIMGVIESIDDYKVNIRIKCRDLNTIISYNIADFKTHDKHFFLWIDGEWKPIKIKITELCQYKDIGQGHHNKYD
jgi:hypothetical protein